MQALCFERRITMEKIKFIDGTEAVLIVRCKECKFRNVTEHGKQQYEDYCRWHPWESPDDDDFCSYGESEK